RLYPEFGFGSGVCLKIPDARFGIYSNTGAFRRVIDKDAPEIGTLNTGEVELSNLGLAVRQILEVDDGDPGHHSGLIEKHEFKTDAAKSTAKLVGRDEGEPASTFTWLQRVQFNCKA